MKFVFAPKFLTLWSVCSFSSFLLFEDVSSAWCLCFTFLRHKVRSYCLLDLISPFSFQISLQTTRRLNGRRIYFGARRICLCLCWKLPDVNFILSDQFSSASKWLFLFTFDWSEFNFFENLKFYSRDFSWFHLPLYGKLADLLFLLCSFLALNV